MRSGGILGGLALLTKGGLAIKKQTIRLDAPILILGALLIVLFVGTPPAKTQIFDWMQSFGLLNSRLDIVEAPRFFEAMLVGRSYEEAVHITSRICGICAVTHTTASLKAIESAWNST